MCGFTGSYVFIEDHTQKTQTKGFLLVVSWVVEDDSRSEVK